VPASERSLKAAFLYKFAGYVRWPEAANSPRLTIGVVAANDFARELADMTLNRTVSNRPIDVRRVSLGDPLDGLAILFIGRDAGEQQPQVLRDTQQRPILTVTETEGALAQGSIINFTVEEERVRFEVALRTAERSGLRLNAPLLAVAKHVYREAPP
jgi:hypothetical protein